MLTTNILRIYIDSARCLTAAKQQIEALLNTLKDSIPSQALADAALEYRRCKRELDDAWEQLPNDKRHVLQPPEHYC